MTQTNMNKFVAIYARISPKAGESEKDAARDTENQTRQLREYLVKQGWQLYDEYVDKVTGKHGDRAQFKRMLHDASMRNFDILLVWALDRLTREGIDTTFEYLKRLKEHGVEFVSYTEEHFRTIGPSGEIMLAIAAWIAKQERVRLVERTIAGVQRYKEDYARGKARESRSKKNLPIGRPRIVINRDRVIEMHNNGISIRQIAKSLGYSHSTVQRAIKGN